MRNLTPEGGKVLKKSSEKGPYVLRTDMTTSRTVPTKVVTAQEPDWRPQVDTSEHYLPIHFASESSTVTKGDIAAIADFVDRARKELDDKSATSVGKPARRWLGFRRLSLRPRRRGHEPTKEPLFGLFNVAVGEVGATEVRVFHAIAEHDVGSGEHGAALASSAG